LLKENRKAWNIKTFGNIHLHVNTTNQLEDEIQDQIERTCYTYSLLDQEKNAQLNLENSLKKFSGKKNPKSNGTLKEIETQPIFIE
jgi:hypothetical protein